MKDSTGKLWDNFKSKNFSMFVGSEKLLLDNLKIGGAGCISATTNITGILAKKVFDDFKSLPEEVRLIVANMMFNLGRPRFSKFKKCIQAIKDGDWLEAGNQMKDSRWYKQVTNRADRLISRMKAVGLH